ncbi:MAG: nucleotidyl transferase AbiEii/AbiGii toxin family protein [Conexivisphaerales archaeon]
MLGKDELIRIAKTRGLKAWQEEERYLQALVLYALRSSNLTCKGGTYLWFFHGLDRFSEDLDFTGQVRLGNRIIDRTIETLGLFSVQATHKVIKDDRYVLSFRIDALGPLYINATDTCRVYVEISRRESILLRQTTVRLDEPLYGIPICFLKGMELKEVFAEKVGAFIRRKAVRDLYDIWFLLARKGVTPDLKLIEKKLSFYKMPYAHSEFEDSLQKVRPNWERELRSTVLGELLPFEEVSSQVALNLRNLSK